jgi:ribokinase
LDPKPRILVVGYLSIDTIETPDARYESLPGGAALYAALGCRFAGGRPSLCACVGEDYPDAWLTALAALGVDTTLIERRPGPTRRAAMVHAPGGERTYAYDAQWWARTRAMTPNVPDLAPYRLAITCPMPIETLAAVLDRAGDVPVVADTNDGYARLPGWLDLIPRLHTFAPSREETRLIVLDPDDTKAALSLARSGPAVLQKRGPQGALAVAPGGAPSRPIAAPPITVLRDPTGAGDATVGALGARLAAGEPFFEAAAKALQAGALTVSQPGPAALGFDVS